jgi:hypothetical protein
MTQWLQAARQDVAPRTKPTQPTKLTGRAIGGGTATEEGVLSVSSVLSGAVRPIPETSGAMPPDPESIRDLLEERAAIREYDGGQTRAEAEAGALGDIARSTGVERERLLRLWVIEGGRR